MKRPLASAVLALLVLLGCAGELSTPGEPLRLLAAALPPAFEGEPYEAPLRPTGGLRPYGFRIVDGEPPPGLRLEGGRLVGTPSRQGRFAFTVELSDANLSRTVQRLELSVRPLPEPVISVDVPPTDLQRPTELRLRLESGRAWRGAEVLITFDAEAFALVPESIRSADRDVIAIWESDPGQLRVDLAATAGPLSQSTDLLRFTLTPLAPPQRLGLTLTAASEAAAGRSLSTRRLGAPQVTPSTAGEPEAPGSEPPEPAEPDELPGDSDDGLPSGPDHEEPGGTDDEPGAADHQEEAP